MHRPCQHLAVESAESGTHVSRKGKEKVDQPIFFHVSTEHSHIDGESSGSEQSLDEELGIPRVVTLGAWRSRDASKTHGNEPMLRRST